MDLNQSLLSSSSTTGSSSPPSSNQHRRSRSTVSPRGRSTSPGLLRRRETSASPGPYRRSAPSSSSLQNSPVQGPKAMSSAASQILWTSNSRSSTGINGSGGGSGGVVVSGGSAGMRRERSGSRDSIGSTSSSSGGSVKKLRRWLSTGGSGNSNSTDISLPTYYSTPAHTNKKRSRGDSNSNKNGNGGDTTGFSLGHVINFLVLATIFYLLLESRRRVDGAHNKLEKLTERGQKFEERINYIESIGTILKEQIGQLREDKEHLEAMRAETMERIEEYHSMDGPAEFLNTHRERVRNQVMNLQTSVQKEAYREVIERWGEGPRYYVDMALEGMGNIRLETAPIGLLPHTVHVFLQQVEEGLWNGCSFVWNPLHLVLASPHVKVPRKVTKNKSPERALEIQERMDEAREELFESSGFGSVSFGEYTPQYPHDKYTVAFAGRPGGPSFYINLDDNRSLHGPQSKDDSADTAFAKVVSGHQFLERMRNRPKRDHEDGWSRDAFRHPVFIKSAKVVENN